MSFENNKIVNQIITTIERRYIESESDHKEFADVPTPQDDDEYKTHMPLVYSEQDTKKEDEEEEEIPKEDREDNEKKEEIPREETREIPREETREIPGEEIGAIGMGMPGEEDEGPKTPEEVGQVYELKKIYSRLVAIESYLNTVSDKTLIKLRNFVSQAIDLFKTLISNVDLFKDKIDQILVTFYKFIDNVYDILKRYYKSKERHKEK